MLLNGAARCLSRGQTHCIVKGVHILRNKKKYVHTCQTFAACISSVLFQYLIPHHVWVDIVDWCSLRECSIRLDHDLPSDVKVCVWCQPKRFFVLEGSYLLHLHDHGPPYLSRTLLVKHLKEVCHSLQSSQKILSFEYNIEKTRTAETNSCQSEDAQPKNVISDMVAQGTCVFSKFTDPSQNTSFLLR